MEIILACIALFLIGLFLVLFPYKYWKFSESWKNFGQGCQDFAVWLVYALPTLLLLFVIPGVILVIVLVSVHRARKKRESNKNDKQE